MYTEFDVVSLCGHNATTRRTVARGPVRKKLVHPETPEYSPHAICYVCCDVTDDAVATRWVCVAKQHYRCSDFNVECIWRQSAECQRVQILHWINSLLVDD